MQDDEVIAIHNSDSDVAQVTDTDNESGVKRQIQKRPIVSGPHKKVPKSKEKKTKIAQYKDEELSFIKSVSSTIQNLTDKLTGKKDDDTVIKKDEISTCVDGLEVKIRSIKKRESRLRLMDAMERLASKYVIDDCKASDMHEITGSEPCATEPKKTANYYPQGLQPITPPRPSVPTMAYANTQYHMQPFSPSVTTATTTGSTYTFTPTATMSSQASEQPMTTLTFITSEVGETLSPDLLAQAAQEINATVNLQDALE
jgi:hypothetical protein